MYSTFILFLIAFILFSLFFSIITIFGYFIFTLIDRKHLKKKISLTLVLKSFGIGLSIYLCYSTIIISFRVFNFFTTYLTFIIFDAIFLIYIYFKTDIIKKEIRGLKLSAILSYLKRNKEYILILIIALIMQYLLQLLIVNTSIAFQERDPYYWFGEIYFVHENGYIKESGAFIRPPGYILMCASITSIIEDFYVFYYFMKYIPLFLMSINVLVIFVISKSIFKEKINTLFAILILLAFKFIIFRNIMPLPSNMATTFGFLLLLFLNKSIVADIRVNNYKLTRFTKKKIIDKNLIFIGLSFAGIFMGHILYCLYYLIFYFSYELLLLIIDLILRGKFPQKNSFFISKFFIEMFFILLYIVLFCIPTLICITVYSTRCIGAFSSYLEYEFPSLKKIDIFIYKKAICFIVFIDYFFEDFLFELPFLEYFRRIYSFTLGIGIFVVVFGVFIKFKKHFDFNEKQSYLINFFRFTFIFLILFVAIINLGMLVKNHIVYDISFLFIHYNSRLYEIFPGFWSIIFILSLNYIFKLIKKRYFEIKKTNKISNKRINYYFKISQLIIILLISGALYSARFKMVGSKKYYDNDARLDALLFIGNYFNEKRLDKETIILFEDLENNGIFDMLGYKNLEKEHYNFSDNDNYDDFKDYFDDHDCEYILLPESELDRDFMEDFGRNFNEIYQNSDYVFAHIKD